MKLEDNNYEIASAIQMRYRQMLILVPNDFTMNSIKNYLDRLQKLYPQVKIFQSGGIKESMPLQTVINFIYD